jgi:ABC-type transport system involved in cytochrome bd biosynthesis fused ATPase/permease subunit
MAHALLLIIAFLAVSVLEVMGFASIALNPYYCTQPMVADEFLMNDYVTETSIR